VSLATSVGSNQSVAERIAEAFQRHGISVVFGQSCSRPSGGDAHAGAAREPSNSIRHAGRCAFMTGRDKSDVVRVTDCVRDCERLPARDTEHETNAQRS